jgi:beta-lactam-binding protein with PASTA domain
MSLSKYITSKVFIRQLVIALVIVLVVAFVFFNMLSMITQHGKEITVPDLSKLTAEKAEEKLNEVNLDFVIIDTLDFDKAYPKYAVVLQDPKAGSKVKEGRKVYLKLNSDGYTNVVLPNLIEKTYRQAVPTLNSIGLEVGEITYKPYLGKDMVLEMKMNGKPVKAGTKVLKMSKIDLVLGDGKIVFEEEQDSLQDENIEINE